jgi:hypothetical protein
MSQKEKTCGKLGSSFSVISEISMLLHAIPDVYGFHGLGIEMYSIDHRDYFSLTSSYLSFPVV